MVLDPNVKGTLTIVLDDVPWDQALDIVLKNNDLARQLDGNVLRIATVDTLRHEAESRRAQQEAEALAVDKITFTRFLSYAHSKDMVPTVKKFLSQRGDVIADDRTNAVIISDIPAVIPVIDRLAHPTGPQDAGSGNRGPRRGRDPQLRARHRHAARLWLGQQSLLGRAARAASGTSPIGDVSASTPNYPMVGTTAPTPTTVSQIPLFSNLAPSPARPAVSRSSNASSHVRMDADPHHG